MQVFLDSCVILSSIPREICLELARRGVVELAYSRSVETESMHVARRKSLEKDIAAAFVSLRLICEPVEVATPDAIWLPDENDRHVLAGAIVSQSDVLLTENLRDFPKAALAPHQIIAKNPDQLFVEIFAADPNLLREVVTTISAKEKALKRAKLYRTAKLFRAIASG